MALTFEAAFEGKPTLREAFAMRPAEPKSSLQEQPAPAETVAARPSKPSLSDLLDEGHSFLKKHFNPIYVDMEASNAPDISTPSRKPGYRLVVSAYGI